MQLSRLSDGKRKVTSIAEITGLEGDIIQMQEIFKFVRTGTGPDNSVIGHFQATGVRPRFLNDLVAMGIKIPGHLFRPVAAAVTARHVVRLRPDLSDLSAGGGLGRAVRRGRLSAVASPARSYRKNVNRRLKLLKNQPDRENILVQLRRERGLTSGGGYSIGVRSRSTGWCCSPA